MRWATLLGERQQNTPGYRPEIQALRAIAAMSVVVYHLWPNRLVGGYTGVDVFFVISGYLITRHLWKDASADKLKLSTFYLRRVRRLSPAALLVLAVTLVGVLTLVPYGQWPTFTPELAAAALFYENWILAAHSVDYLGSESAPSPVQHYWSLSVEEQFYLVWPLLILVATKALRGRAEAVRLRAVGVLLAVAFVASLAFCVSYTHSHPAPAYFVTPTRVWQFAAGGLLALAEQARNRRREGARHAARHGDPAAGPQGGPLSALVSWAGLAVVVGSILFLNSNGRPYPGSWALLPVLGTMLVIGAGSGGRSWLSPRRLYGLAPIQFLGTVSYPVYLWHWPLIVLLPFVSGSLTTADKLGILAATIVLAVLTILLVENPIRFSPRLSARRWLTAGLAAVVALGLVVAPAQAMNHVADNRFAAAKAAAVDKVFDDPCYGAKALADKSCGAADDKVTAAAAGDAARDEPQPFRDGCIDPLGAHHTTYCDYGDTKATATVLVWGDSHAAAWAGAFDVAGQKAGVHVIDGSRQGCPPTLVAPTGTVFRAIGKAEQGFCDARNQQMLQLVKDTPSLKTVVLASYSSDYVYGPKPGSAGYYAGTVQLIEQLHTLGVDVYLLGDVPMTGPDPTHRTDVPTCLAQHLSDPSACDVPSAKALATTGVRDAVAASPAAKDVTVVDTSSQFCAAGVCHSAVGGLPVFFDSSHITDSYSRSIGPWMLKTVLQPALKAAAKLPPRS